MHILAQEGQRDDSFAYPDTTIFRGVGEDRSWQDHFRREQRLQALSLESVQHRRSSRRTWRNDMKTLRNEKGFAMVFVLILAAIALAMTLAMLIMVSRGSFVSGQQKRFRTAVEAGRGGMEAMFQLIVEPRESRRSPWTPGAERRRLSRPRLGSRHRNRLGGTGQLE